MTEIQDKLTSIDYLFKIFIGNINKITKENLIIIYKHFYLEENKSFDDEFINITKITKKALIYKIYEYANHHLIDLTGVPNLDYINHYTIMVDLSKLNNKLLLFKILLLKLLFHKFKGDKIVVKEIVKIPELSEIREAICELDDVIVKIRKTHEDFLIKNGFLDDSQIECLVSSRPIMTKNRTK